MNIKQIGYVLLMVVALSTISITIILLASGYRFNLETGSLEGTGIISANSSPSGALVYINDVPTEATNNSITSLRPDSYKLRMEKDGFAAWEKEITVKKELVTDVDALLIPLYPTFQPLTFTGLEKPRVSPDGEKVIYTVKQGPKTGLWMLDLSDRPFYVSRDPSPLLEDTELISYSNSDYRWGPLGESLLIELETTTIDIKETKTYKLLNVNSGEVEDAVQADILETWDELSLQQTTEKLSSLEMPIANEISSLEKAKWSPDNEFILHSTELDNQVSYFIYAVDNSRSGEPSITPPNQYNITENSIVSFDTSSNHSVTWYPDSRHLVISTEIDGTTTVEIMEIDGYNRTPVFSGYVNDLTVFPNPNGNKIIVLTNFNTSQETDNLYSINLRN